MDLDRIRNLIIGFVLISLIAAAGAIALFDFQSNEQSKHTTSITNESVTLTAVTATIANETVTMDSTNSTATLANNYLTTLTELRNVSSEVITSFCNVTLSTGGLVCNTTHSNTIYAQYTYNSYSTGTLGMAAYYESTSACRNTTGSAILLNLHCNITNGAVRGNYDNFTGDIAYIDYSHYTVTHLMNITNNGLLALDNTTSYFGTAGTIAGVALLLTIVIGSFYFITRRQGA